MRQKELSGLIPIADGLQLRTLILSALDYRRISNADDDMKAVVAKAEGALKAIARKSELNALRIQKYGIQLSDEDGTNEDRAEL